LVILRRLSDHAALWTELFECVALARIFFGEDMEQAVRAFWVQRTAVYVSAQMYGDIRPADFLDRCERDFWEGAGAVPMGPGDAVAEAVTAAFDSIERIILPLVSDRAPRLASTMASQALLEGEP
jgi:hypothetical protein